MLLLLSWSGLIADWRHCPNQTPAAAVAFAYPVLSLSWCSAHANAKNVAAMFGLQSCAAVMLAAAAMTRLLSCHWHAQTSLCWGCWSFARADQVQRCGLVADATAALAWPTFGCQSCSAALGAEVWKSRLREDDMQVKQSATAGFLLCWLTGLSTVTQGTAQ